MEEMVTEIPNIDLDEKGRFYKKKYRMNTVGKDGATTTVAIPPDVIERKAEENNMTIKQFTEEFRVVWHYNSFPGIWAKFEPKVEKGE